MTSLSKHTGKREILKTMIENNIVASYVGPFDGDILSLLANNIKGSLWENQNQGKRFFKIFIELAQNISLYSAEKSPTRKNTNFGEGTLIINEYDDHFLFSAGNIVHKNTSSELLKKCELINSLDRNGLRKLKIELRERPHELGGGNIGLVQVALMSKHKLNIKLVPIEETENFFYIIGVRIDK